MHANVQIVLIGILIDNSRLSDLRAYMDSRFTALERITDANSRRVEEVLDARLTRIELKIR